MKTTVFYGPPGTGKTETLIKIGKEQRGGLFLSYTKAAAEEAAARSGEYMTPSTIHAYAFRALNMNRASVVDNAKLVRFGNTIGIPFKDVKNGVDEIQEGDEYAACYSYAANRRIEYDKAYDDFGRPGANDRWRMFIDGYSKWKTEFGFMDFDDMLLVFLRTGKAGSVVRVFVDEAQDLSPLQWQVVDRIVVGADEVYIGGDDDQAIYEWNGADPHGMEAFRIRHRGAQVVLNRSHRVPRCAHVVANDRLTGHMARRVSKQWEPADRDGLFTRYGDITDVDLLALKGETMILARDKWRVDEIKRSLNRDMVPYSAPGGMSPWTSKLAQALRAGERPEIPPSWYEFYKQADLTLPINTSVSTIHQAKGREAETVIVDLTLTPRTLVGIDLNRDAELRVMYVALTRASHHLILCGENPLI